MSAPGEQEMALVRNERDRQAHREALARWRAWVQEASGTPEERHCIICKRQPLQVAYRSSGDYYVLCGDCMAKDVLAKAERLWATSVKQGTPGTVEFYGLKLDAPDPATLGDPLAEIEVAACEVCEQLIAPPSLMRDRREVLWCGRIECRAEATRLAKRVPAKEPRECEGCGEMFTPVRSDQRFHDSACRSRSHRERMQGEMCRALRISPAKRSGGGS